MKKDPKDKEIAKLQKELAKSNEKIQKLKQEKSELRADNRKKRIAGDDISRAMAQDFGNIKGRLRGFEYLLMVIMMCCSLRAQTGMRLRTIAKAVGIMLDIMGI